MALSCRSSFFFLFLFAFSFISMPTNARPQKAEIVVVDIRNALPNNTQTEVLKLRCGGASLDLNLGSHYNESVKMGQNFGCTAVWMPWFTSWDALDANRDKGHHYIYWLVKKDGFYQSWDKSLWKKVEQWYSE